MNKKRETSVIEKIDLFYTFTLFFNEDILKYVTLVGIYNIYTNVIGIKTMTV